ncbi:MBL fold metallo-hydrolase [Oceanospirillaceae bacterium G-43]|uniref:MBL fold metallo-hydrolase n=1 Tax=Parathalassolituus penaei TaxID=2997323 RepID=A0A9X3EG79_9GAMM|nr:MBL fold metallo-hydrolase [Parathalassolituus penaei]MCY0966957.1 MBL fold metallo-hydrolase [Parathalassolituus penaei]
MFEITHHGAISGVTGSCHQLTLSSGEALLVDCGLFQGAETRNSEHGSNTIDFDWRPVKALIVTHCHIDHVGRIPWLLAAGYKGPIYATRATAYLLPLVIEDAVKVGVTQDADIINMVLQRLRQQLVPLDYKQWLVLPGFPDVRLRFQVAGHILGSAYVELDIGSANSPLRKKVVFSGDLGAPWSPLLPAPRSPWGCDTLVIESTYGDRCHDGRKQRRQRLESVLKKALSDGGAVLIPAFSIGRTQELLYELEDIFFQANRSDADSGVSLFQAVDVIVDSPLATEFTDCYRELADLWDAEARQRLARGRHPLKFDKMLTINHHEQHLDMVQYLKRSGRPAIVLAAGGMCSGGRIVNYLKALLPDSRTNVLFVGYQAVGTPGRAIQDWGPEGGYVDLDGERTVIRAGIETLGGYSAHADQKDLVRFVRGMRKHPAEIRIVHGDTAARKALARELENLCPQATVLIPTANS